MDKLLPKNLVETVKYALSEDIASGDITTQLVKTNTQAIAKVISRKAAILCGTAWFDEVFRQLNGQVQITWQVADGNEVYPNQVLCELNGTATALLTGERTALNFLQLLSATATQTNLYVQAIKNTNTRILDTRKTLPGLRHAQKYAVRCGGGTNHRIGLYDAFLIKENHIATIGSIKQAVISAQQLAPHLMIEVEVETLNQIEEAIVAGANSLLLDNFTLEQLQEAVKMVQGRVKLEASGGITSEAIAAIAKTGVDFISLGTITKDVKAIDLSMRIDIKN
ncbi:MAG: carboxylating nicotinate-nucleotide diphosphorylase [Thiomargarita sp.]|nr:carboxylating nicotinate-nucleotide diphosphorylase [Thiomargarita sp.]